MPQTTLEETFPGGPGARTVRRAILDKGRYTAPAALVAEWDRVWTRCWLFAGLASDVREPGDYFVYNLGRESVVILRGEDGELRAFYNVCQHRGNRIFTNESGWIRQVACPYHGWQYALDGTLAVVPDSHRFCPAIDTAARSLKPVHVAVRAGMVWLNMDPQAAPLEDFLGPLLDRLDAYRIDELVLARHQSVRIAANWKTVRDNFLEQYHVDFIHPQHASLVDCCNSENTLWPFGHSATRVQGYVTDSRYPVPERTPEHLAVLLRGLGLNPSDFDDRVPHIREAVQRRKRTLGAELGFDYAGLSDEQLTDIWQFDLFPNTFMTVQAEEVWIFGPRPHPTDPEVCFFDKWTLQVPIELGCDRERGLTLNPSLAASRDGERPPHEVFSQEDVIAGRHSLTVTLDQDIQYLADMQAGMHSRGFDCAVLNEDEVRVQHFHDWLDARLADA